MGVFEEAIITGNEILKYIPQRAPIVMVDSFYGMNEIASCCGLTVIEENIFCKDNKLEETGLIEHIAQSAAFRIGYTFISQNKPVPLGFIGAISKFSLNRQPKIGEKLKTYIKIEQEVFNITLLAAEVKIDEEVIAECQMKVATSEQKNGEIDGETNK